MNGYIISRYNNYKMPASVLLEKECVKRNIDIKQLATEGIHESGGKLFYNNKEIEERDFIILRTKDGLLTNKVCNLKTSKCVNDFEMVKYFGNKINQLNVLRSVKSFKIPKYLIGTLSISFELVEEKLKLPFVIKHPYLFQGKGTFLVKDLNDFEEIRKQFSRDVFFVYQEYIEESKGKDLRVFILNGEPLYCVKRISNNDFRANYSLGGSLERFDISNEIKDIADEISTLVGLDYSGLDLLFSNDGFAFCELNVNPMISKDFDDISNVEVSRRLIDYIVNKK